MIVVIDGIPSERQDGVGDLVQTILRTCSLVDSVVIGGICYGETPAGGSVNVFGIINPDMWDELGSLQNVDLQIKRVGELVQDYTKQFSPYTTIDVATTAKMFSATFS
ncbi:MAG: hypothetical protein WC773_01585 [Patescibacteria group bacterium]|jgi:hypothetical protein